MYPAGVFMVQGGIAGMIVLCISTMSTFPMIIFNRRPKGFMGFFCSFGIVLSILDKKNYSVQDLLGMTSIRHSTGGPVYGF